MFAGRCILLISWDPKLNAEFCQFFHSDGYKVVCADSEQQIQSCFATDFIDLVVLDLSRESGDQSQIILLIREHESMNSVPILVLLEPGMNLAKRNLIFQGADEIIEKPILYSELDMRIIANLRRAKTFLPSDQLINANKIQINLKTQHVSVEGKSIKLTKTEYKLFLELFSKPGVVHAREDLVQRFLPNKNANARTLDVHVNALRKKLGAAAQYLKTIRGRGYIFQWDKTEV